MENKIYKILVIDDDEVDRIAVRQALKKAEITVEIKEVNTYKRGEKALLESEFDCAIMDYRLPDGDGLVLLQDIRKAGVTTPVIVLTGHGHEELVMEMINSGASDYITKGGMSAKIISKSIQDIIRLNQAEIERIKAEEELKQSNQEIVNILESITDAFFAINVDWKFTYINKQAEMLFEQNREKLLGTDIWTTLPEASKWFRDKFDKAIASKTAIHAEQYYPPLNLWLEIHAYPDQNGGLSLYLQDITSRKISEQRINFLATHDVLTELPNRLMLIDRINQAMSRKEWHKTNIAILFVDLDRFKHINDSFGHRVGDHLLKAISDRLKSIIRGGDTVSRLGGDEFVILLTDLASSRHAFNIAEKIQTAFTQYFDILGNAIFSTASIGISAYPGDGENAETLITNADAAMYRAKSLGKNRIEIYSPSMNEKTPGRASLESELRLAVKQNQFRLYYQPIVEATNHTVIGAEALIRWEHPTHGLLLPGDFLQLAEDIGIMNVIDEWVLNAVVEQHKQWRKTPLSNLRISVNVSNSTFTQHDFEQKVISSLKDVSLDTPWLELELTENIIIGNFDSSSKVLHDLKELGIRIALDDFGTGYSSLTYLKRLPVDTLKIDRSFISDIENRKEDKAIVVSTIELSHGLNLCVTAEGVETSAQATLLKKLQCDFLQGYHYSRPITPEALKEIINDKLLIAKSAG